MSKISFIRHCVYNKQRCRQVSDYFEMKREAESKCGVDEIAVTVGFDKYGKVLHTIGIDLDREKFRGFDVRKFEEVSCS